MVSWFPKPVWVFVNIATGVLATKESGGSAIEKSIATVEPPTWAEYYRKLARALSGREPVPVSGSEARDIIQIIELAIISSQLKETVEIP